MVNEENALRTLDHKTFVGLRVLTTEELLLVSGGENPSGTMFDSAMSSSMSANYGISSGPTTEVAGAVGTALTAAGAFVKGPAGLAISTLGAAIDVAAALGYTTPQSVVNAGYIEYGMSIGESYGGNYGGSSFGNDFGDPNGPGSNTNVA